MWPRAAAMPPSAITVCALPSSDLQTRAVRAPWAEASMAARSPAPPAPMTITSNSCVSYSGIASSGQLTVCPLEVAPGVRVRDVPVRHQPDVHVREDDPDQAGPGPEAVVNVPQGDVVPDTLAGPCPGGAAKAVQAAADQVPDRVAGKRVHHEEEGVHTKDERAQPDTPALVRGMEAADGADPEEHHEDERDVHEEAVQVLEDQREAGLAAVRPAGVA